MGNGLIEGEAEGEVEEVRRELVDRLVEAVAKDDVSDGGGEVIHGLVEVEAKGEVGEVVREVGERGVEIVREGEVSNLWGEHIWCQFRFREDELGGDEALPWFRSPFEIERLRYLNIYQI